MIKLHPPRIRSGSLVLSATALLSLVLVALWATSHIVTFQLVLGGEASSNDIVLADGDLVLKRISGQPGPSFFFQIYGPSDTPHISITDNGPAPTVTRWWRFDLQRRSQPPTLFQPGWTSWELQLPFATVNFPILVLLAWTLVQRRESAHRFEPILKA